MHVYRYKGFEQIYVLVWNGRTFPKQQKERLYFLLLLAIKNYSLRAKNALKNALKVR